MTGEYYDLWNGRVLPVVTTWARRDYTAHVLRGHDDERDVAGEWILTWTDGINIWLEEYELPWQALARLAALVAAAEQDVFLVHPPSSRGINEGRAFVEEAERFVSRTVHTSSCQPGCDGTDPENHDV